MSRGIPSSLIAVSLSVVAAACGEEEPSEDGEYYPMSVGDYWVYEETGVYGGDATELRYEVTGAGTVELDYVGGTRDVFEVENTFPGTSDERRLQYIADDGTRAARVRHEIYDESGDLTKVREFDPGFLRFDRSRTGEGDEWTEDIEMHNDFVDGSEVEAQSLQYRFEVIDRSREVTVPAGTFDCLVLKRSEVFGTVGEVKVYYLAPGVGKVKEITENDKEEDLVEYHVGGDQ